MAASKLVGVLYEFISNKYKGPIIEVGCGRHSAIALALSRFFRVIATDILETDAVDSDIRHIYVKDDVTRPNLRLYFNADLIYSIRPPVEIQRSILDLCELVHADVIIKPFGSEIIEDARIHLANYRGLSVYLSCWDSEALNL